MKKPLVYAGPCVAESFELLDQVCSHLVNLSKKLDFDLVFKSSFDKANRTSMSSYRGPGIAQTMKWFSDLKSKYHVKVLTDIHEPKQAAEVADIVDVIQIPAFLCRQTDLLVAAAQTGKFINVKKGQFVAPESMKNAVEKISEACLEKGLPLKMALTERGATFGYGNLVVDPRSFKIMSEFGVPIIFDITHSTQLPGTATNGKTSGGDRMFAPVLARAATATGYLSGYFLEVHPDPKSAKSDAAVQLSMLQAESLLSQIIPFWRLTTSVSEIDRDFI